MSSTHLDVDVMGIELPDHKQLPDRAPNHAKPNMQQSPQTELLNQCLYPILDAIHPDGQYCVASDCFIYYKYTQPVLAGCKGPDWFYVPGIAPMLDGEIRRSYVLWKECVRPLIVIEYVSHDGREEHDRTPHSGKFWVYEQAIAATYYAIFDPQRSSLEVYQLVNGRYQQMTPNGRGRYFISPMRVEFGVWEGIFRKLDGAWLRVWAPDTDTMLISSEERAELAEAGLEETRDLLTEQIAATEDERKRAEKLAARLLALGIDPDEPDDA